MDKKLVIENTKEYVKERLSWDSTGHDWWHAYRVWKNAVQIAKVEDADLFIVELAALLHDIADWKFHNGDQDIGPEVAREWLVTQDIDENTIEHIVSIIKHISFKGAKVKANIASLEGKIVQDADRLDAIGAIGIARAFAYGGNRSRPIYEPEIKPQLHETFEQYKNNHGTTINHFYEKLLLLKDRMNTNTGKLLAEERHQYMESFLQRFFREWDGEG